MGFRFRKSIKLSKGVRLNFNKKSVSLSVGTKGRRVTINSNGKKTTTVGIPGTGISYSRTTNLKSSTSKSSTSHHSSSEPPNPYHSDAICETSPKSKTTALILAIILGFLGIHRFYVGKTGTGILWLLTCGCFGIGWTVDIILIASNNFRDKNNCLITSHKKRPEPITKNSLPDRSCSEAGPPEEMDSKTNVNEIVEECMPPSERGNAMKSSGNAVRVLGIIIIVFGLMASLVYTVPAIIFVLLGGFLTVKGGDKVCKAKGIEPKPIFRRKWIYVVAVFFLIGLWGQSLTVPIESITFEDSTSQTIDLNTTQEISASVQPDGATTTSLQFCSSDESILKFEQESIDGNLVTGKITPIGEGTAKIYITTDDETISTETITVNIVDKARIEADKKAAEEKERQQQAHAKVDSIARKAKESAKTASEADLKTAYTFIHDTYTDCFGSNDVMEQMMYYGWLMEYAYEGNESMRNYYNVGQDAEQLVKDVYRGIETPADVRQQENLRQIKKSIEKIDKEAAEKAAAEEKANQEAAAAQAKAEQQEITVYITDTGSKYHSSGCRTLRKSKIETTLKKATANGYEPCGICHPPTQ